MGDAHLVPELFEVRTAAHAEVVEELHKERLVWAEAEQAAAAVHALAEEEVRHVAAVRRHEHGGGQSASASA